MDGFTSAAQAIFLSTNLKKIVLKNIWWRCDHNIFLKPFHFKLANLLDARKFQKNVFSLQVTPTRNFSLKNLQMSFIKFYSTYLKFSMELIFNGAFIYEVIS